MTPSTQLTGAAARSAEGTATGHENAEGMACSGVRIERPVRQDRSRRLERSLANVALIKLRRMRHLQDRA